MDELLKSKNVDVRMPRARVRKKIIFPHTQNSFKENISNVIIPAVDADLTDDFVSVIESRVHNK